MEPLPLLPIAARAPPPPPSPPGYAELHCLSAFSFQRGASLPEELVQRAHALGYRALALTDECSVAGMVRAHLEAKRLALQLLPGAEFAVAPPAFGRGGADGAEGVPDVLFRFVALAHDLQGWGNLCEFITSARRAAPKGEYALRWQSQTGAEKAAGAGGFDAWPPLDHNEIVLLMPPGLPIEQACAVAASAKARYGAAVWLGLSRSLGAQDGLHTLRLQQIAQFTGLSLVATGGVRMHLRSRKPLHDVLSAVRLGLPVAQCGRGLQPNAERHLRSRARLGALFDAAPLAHTLTIASRCNFSLDSLRYHYPMEAVLPGHTPAQTLRQYTQEGAAVRYPGGVPASVQAQLEHELALIAELKYEMYFLTVHDIVRFARSQGILCQGRGSAANSAVCYCLGVTEVDPSRTSVLFERFISRERDEPPDIDVDFEHQRREEVIQYIYAKYGRERAAITAVVTSYRPRSALRDVGRALQIPEALITAMSKEHPGMYSRTVLAERLEAAIERVAGAAGFAGGGRLGGKALSSVSPARCAGSSFTYAERSATQAHAGENAPERSGAQALAGENSSTRPATQAPDAQSNFTIPSPRRLQQWLDLATQLQRFPRHLSQHVGGFVLTQGPLTRIVPVENAAMPDRSIIQWDKDDLDAVGLLKVDVLALGMLSAIHRCLDLVGQWRGKPLRMQDIPAEDAATYDMICQADTVGVFQIESRAQMSMLPRLKPRCFYDLVVQVAIVRPGPIQGGMVHPYLQARANPGAVQYASPALEEVLKRTLGVPIFQEQVMQIAMAAANFSGGEADSLRRSMAAWKRKGGVHHFYDRLVGAMVANGYTQVFSDRLFKQLEGFGEYGFPESHAASFALLVYVSCWLKRHEPACFLAAMLNSQPLGFYAPSQLVQDARRHGVQVRPVDVNHSDWDCTLEQLGSDPDSGQQPDRSARSPTKSGSDPICGHAQTTPCAQVQATSPPERTARQPTGGQSPISFGTPRAENTTVLNRDPTPLGLPPVACCDKCSLGALSGEEQLGSDPDSGQQPDRSARSPTKSGSDPICGHAQTSPCAQVQATPPPERNGRQPNGGQSPISHSTPFAENIPVLNRDPTPLGPPPVACCDKGSLGAHPQTSPYAHAQAPDPPHPAIRLGLRMVGGLREDVAQRIAQERTRAPFASTQDLAHRCGLDAGDLKALASADALRSLSGHRRQQVWDASALHAAPALFRGVPVAEEALALPAAWEGEEVVFDYAATGLSLRQHPVAFLRPQLAAQKLLSAAQMHDFPHGRLARACGIVTMRQQPHTAKGVIFLTLEDETGSVNVIVWKAVKEAFRAALYRARLLAVYGVWQRDEESGGQVRHLIAKRLVDLTHLLGDLAPGSRDFH